jgi:DNA polymerase (family X)
MTNDAIADYFTLLGKLMDINGENSFKSKSYTTAAYHIEKLQVQLNTIETQKIETLNGIGVSTAKKIIELLETNKLKQIEELLAVIPAGVIEMLQIKGLGPKKIRIIWKEMELDSIGELLYACKENRLKLYKGFGEKTQDAVITYIEFYLKNKGNLLYSQVVNYATDLKNILEQIFENTTVQHAGEFARQLEIITHLSFVINASFTTVKTTLQNSTLLEFISEEENILQYKTSDGINVKIFANDTDFIETVIKQTSSNNFYGALQTDFNTKEIATDEVDFFTKRNLPFIPNFLREDEKILKEHQNITNLITVTDIKGLIHCHSNWSDGGNTIEEMALAAKANGMEYMVMSDHSKSAYYAQGLNETQIQAQHQLIDELNIKLAPFKIYKSIESDILNDGNLDYSNNILSTFDVVIASVHSNLKMTEEKAMKRLLTAIENPYTTILGHLTGRLLLSRPAYPLDFKKIIDACAANQVAIELNANPNRLDIDWREIGYALEKNVLISINPDSHSTTGIKDVQYGVLVAQKAMLRPTQNLSSFSLAAFENFVVQRKKSKGI